MTKKKQKRNFTLKTRALCVVKQCCKKRALWFPAMLWRSTRSTPPRTLSLSSEATTVCRHTCTHIQLNQQIILQNTLITSREQLEKKQHVVNMVKVTLTTISSVSRTIREASVDRFPSTTDSCSISALVLFTWIRITSQRHKKNATISASRQ